MVATHCTMILNTLMSLLKTTKGEDIGVTVNKKIKRIGCSTLKELLEEGRLSVVDRATITELMTFVTKGNSFELEDIMTIWL